MVLVPGRADDARDARWRTAPASDLRLPRHFEARDRRWRILRTARDRGSDPDAACPSHEARSTVRSWLALWCAGWLLIVVLALVPGDHLGPLLRFPHAEPALHFAGCASMVAGAALFCRSTAGLAGIAVLSIALTGTLELFQTIVPDRGASLSDGAANAGGAVAGLVVAWIAGRLGRSFRRRDARAEVAGERRVTQGARIGRRRPRN